MLHLALPHKIGSAEYNILAAALRQGRVVVPHYTHLHARHMLSEGHPGPALASVLHSQLTLESLGFTYGRELALTLSWLPVDWIAAVHGNLVSMLKRSLGAHQVFQPMYPNFPEQVLEASDAELLANAFMHYAGDWFGVRILPAYAAAPRAALLEKRLDALRPTVLTLAPETEVIDHLCRLLNGNASLSAANKGTLVEMLDYFSGNYPGHLLHILQVKATIPQKEIRALVGGWLIRHTPSTFEAAELSRLFGTATDVLRLAAAVGGRSLLSADLTLSSPPRFARMSRGQRRLLLSLLNAVPAANALPEMFARREQWLRLGECLHPAEYAKQFAGAAQVFGALRNNETPPSWIGDVETALAKGKPLETTRLLSERPGVFARKLHEVLRKAPEEHQLAIVESFGRVAAKASTPVLLQLRHRMVRDVLQSTASAYPPKAGVGRLWVPDSPAPRVPLSIATAVVNLLNSVLTARFAQLPALGKVYVDPALRGYTVPFGQRTAQKALHTVGRGSRVSLGDSAIMRAFLWWNEKGVDKAGNPMKIGRTDLDLSCAVLDADFEYVEHCSYTSLRRHGLTHSGDITSAPSGACEFIDIEFAKLPTEAAYIALVAYAYTQQNFGDLPEAYLGWMARADGQSGDIYDAQTVKQKVDLTAEGQRLLVGYLDVAQREFVWADVVLPARCAGWNAVETSTTMVGKLARGVIQPLRPVLYDLAALHATARGTLVDSPEDADVVFTTRVTADTADRLAGKSVITAYQSEVLAADYLQ